MKNKVNKKWLNTNLSIEDRVDDLISQMSLSEKLSQLIHNSAELRRLDIPKYNWWNEALHGIARNGKATVFPQAIALAATFDEKLIYRVASSISDEARAKFNIAVSNENRSQYAGLTFWTPNINIYRDPRWGRGQETFGEDPFLTSRIGSAFVKGLQGNHDKYLKTAACAKHFAVHSGPEALRHEFDALPPLKDFYETYLPAFEALVKEAKVEGVMGAYNRTFGEPCCGSSKLLKEILRKEWGFEGYTVSDCWAVADFHSNHKVTKSAEESAALAINSGINLNCGNTYPHLKKAVENGKVSVNTINSALRYLFKTRFRLGFFDPPESNPFNNLSSNLINSNKNKRLAREVAGKSIVLLKNSKVLPLKNNLNSIYIVGPYAANSDILLGNYYGISDELVTILEGIVSKVSLGTTVNYKYGFLEDRQNVNPIDWSTGEAHDYDAIIITLGISGLLEGEEGDAIASPTKGDRLDLKLPENQIKYLKTLRSKGEKPIIALVTGGSPMTIGEVLKYADAVMWVWYPGEQGGHAVADILFGDTNPSGRLPITFPMSTDQLPPYEDYSMENRTYKFMKSKPLFPFGFGLSYTKFKYLDLSIENKMISENDHLNVNIRVRNIGGVNGEEVVQLYLTDIESSVRVPFYSLVGFKRIMLKSDEEKTIQFAVNPTHLRVYDENGNHFYEKGDFKLIAGGSSPGKRALELGSSNFVDGYFTLK